MADWLLHYATGRVATIPARGAVLRECLLLGAVLPDVPAKLLDVGAKAAWVLFRADDAFEWTAVASHAPLVWTAIAYGLAHLFREPLRPAAFGGLLVGGWLHILVDLGKGTMGHGAVMLGFPFSRAWQDLGWYHYEDTLRFAPWALGTVLLVEGAAWWRRRNAGRGSA